MRRIISKSAVDRLRPGKSIADTALVGFVVRRWPSGVVTYGFRYRDKRDGGRQRWISIGEHGPITADQARAKALQIAKDVREHREPLTAREEATQRRASAGNTVNAALDNFLSRYVRPNLRSAAEVERCFNVYVRPAIGSMALYGVRRRDVVGLLDRIEDNGAPVMADRVLAHLRKCFNWIAARDDQFTPPIVRGMARTKPQERARSRMLDDQELRDLWVALDSLGDKAPKCFPAFVRFLLLSAQRRRMASHARWEEIDGTDWIIAADRNKAKVDQVVPLTDTLLTLIGPKQKHGFIFSSDGGKTPFSGFSKSKSALDARLAALRKAAGRPAMKPWVFHDLRRCASSWMHRAGVPGDHVERTLGHKVRGVAGIYNRYEFRDEKRAALEKLDAQVERILHPNEKIISFPKRRKR
jgi:integrase